MKIAIIGAGVSGLVCAHLLHSSTSWSVRGERGAGGHANTVRVETETGVYDLDTGFIVFNDRNYPTSNGCWTSSTWRRKPSLMSFGVSDGSDFEYNGASPNGLFASRRQLIKPSFHRMIATSSASTGTPVELLASDEDPSLASGWLSQRHYSRAFVERLIVPQASAVWSADPAQMWSFPGALPGRVLRQPRDARIPWSATLANDHRRVAQIRRGAHAALARASQALDTGDGDHLVIPDHVTVSSRGCESERFDAVVIATHSDQALALLADPSERERELLGAIPYQQQRGGAAHRSLAAPAAPARVGELELPSRTTGVRDAAR